MNKVCIIGDLHFGARGDSILFHSYFQKFFDNILFPYLIENNIKKIIQLGDIFDRRKMININTLDLSKEYFFNKLVEYDIKMITLLGNHDIYFKNTNKVNSQQSLLSDYTNIQVCNEFTTIDINGVMIDIIPWICEENEEDISQKMRKSESEICFGHLELNGFQVYQGNVFKGGKFDNSIFQKYEMVITGHFHHRSDNGHVFYLGTPYEITWNDFGSGKGFHIFDLNTRSLEFIENPYKMFRKINYNHQEVDVHNFDYSDYSESYVKVMVVSKGDQLIFDTFIENLEKEDIYNIKIIEDYTEDIEEEVIDESEDTLTILSRVIDSSDLNVDGEKLKLLMREIYIEALDLGRGDL